MASFCGRWFDGLMDGMVWLVWVVNGLLVAMNRWSVGWIGWLVGMARWSVGWYSWLV